MVQGKIKYGRSLYTPEELLEICKKRYGKNYRIKYDLIMSKPIVEMHERDCLSCQKHFKAKSKYERICQYCKEKDEWKSENFYL